MRVFLTGATGFVGRHVLTQLLAEGHSVNALVRDPGRTTQPPRAGVGYVQGDVVSGAGIDQCIQGCEGVIHLVGIIVEKGKNTFEAVHHLGTRHVVEAAQQRGIKRFVHMSALGVRADGVARYQTSKWLGEEEVRRSGIPYCILRPSLIFGPGDGFVTQMMETMRKAPLFRPVPGDGRALYRPVFIGDVSSCFVRALTAPAATNQTVALGGAQELSLNQVLDEIARCARVRKPAIHIPLPLMFAGAAVAERILPNPPVTMDQLRMLGEGSTCDISEMKRIFALEPRGFEGCGRS
jgi:uncharacterized protein YbjT (DUF2867 family)